jgi:hypothetical protein
VAKQKSSKSPVEDPFQESGKMGPLGKGLNSTGARLRNAGTHDRLYIDPGTSDSPFFIEKVRDLLVDPVDGIIRWQSACYLPSSKK